MTTKQKGNIALTSAIKYFDNNNWTVLIPLNDSQDYDLAFEDDDGEIKKVQCKYTSCKAGVNKDKFIVKLYVCGHRDKNGNNYCKFYKEGSIDYFFIETENNDKYLIPYEDVKHLKSYTINESSNKYLIEIK